MATLAQLKAWHMEGPEFRAAYAEADAVYSVIEELIRARTAAGLTQAEFARRAGMTQSAVTRLHAGRVWRRRGVGGGVSGGSASTPRLLS